MGIRQLQYAEEFEKGKKAGLSTEQAHKRATRLATVKKSPAGKKQRKKKFSEETLIERTRRRLKELFYGPKTYLPKKKKQIKTTRTNKNVGEMRKSS